MVFCCIAIVGVAIAYWAFLSLRQLFSGPRRDPNSRLPVPPRALTGNASQPVFGHTGLFTRLGGDIALKFPPHWKEWGYWLPPLCSREIGDCFSVFIWGQWRVVIKGPERCRQILDSPDIKEDWAWSPPVSLLGKSCLLEGEEKEFLHRLLGVPLSQKNVQRFAPEFAKAAERYVDELLDGNQHEDRVGGSTSFNNKSTSDHSSSSRSISSGSSSPDNHDEEGNDNNTTQANGLLSERTSFKVKWKALRAYTLDLVDGPVLGMNRLQQGFTGRTKASSDNSTSNSPSGLLNKNTESSLSAADEAATAENDAKVQKHKSNLLLWMDRLKRALCVIKITMGPEWMYVWIMSEYGRAVNARMHLTKIISKHVSNRVEESGDVEHKVGHAIHDPLSMPIPIWSLAERVLRRNESVVGQEGIPRQRQRRRSLSEGHAAEAAELNELYGRNDDSDSVSSSSADDEPSAGARNHNLPSIPEPDALMNDGSIHSRRTLATGQVVEEGEDTVAFVFEHEDATSAASITNRMRSKSEPCAFPRRLHPKVMQSMNDNNTRDEAPSPKRPKPAASTSTTTSILDHLLRQQDLDGNGLTQAVTTDVCILLWMMMDAGNAWTAMALKLLSLDYEACHCVQLELDQLAALYGTDKLFSPAVMKQMVALDALLYEAIRLCPSFLGGMKKTKHTVELQDCHLQIPKNTHVVFCQASSDGFDLSKAMGEKPEKLGKAYPCPELYGFLPYKGVEVPLMVLQSKVFLAVLLRRCSPHMTKKRTIVRKLKERFRRDSQANKAGSAGSGSSGDDVPTPPSADLQFRDTSDHYSRFEDEHSSRHNDSEQMPDLSFSSVKVESTDDNFSSYLTPSSLELGQFGSASKITSQTNCMQLFDKIPFPEPRRIINVRKRESALELLGGGCGANSIANVV